MIVVDTNVILYLFLPGERTQQAKEVFRKDPVWVAPILWKSEFRNILSLYLRKKLLTLNQAKQLIDEAEYLMQDNQFDVPSFQVLSLAAISECSAYDCEFVALADELGVALITSDKKILKSFRSTAISLDTFIKLNNS